MQNVYVEEAVDARQELASDKKIVFLIGDSIRLGYCGTVREALADAAEVVYPEDNCRFSQYILVGLKQWAGLCDPQRVALVQFNCGHWDAARWNGDSEPLNSPQSYGENIRRIIESLRRTFPNAKIVFATTTPMNPNGSNSPNPRTTQDIMAYNEAGAAAAAECGVEVNDLFAFTRGWDSSCFRDFCHFTDEHSGVLGRHVADVLRSML